LAAARAQRQADLVEEPLADLIHGDEFLKPRRADIEPRRAAEREGRMARHHGRVRVARAEAGRDVISQAGRVLLHAGEVRADLEARDHRAAVLRVRPEQREAAGREGGLAELGVEHAAQLRIARVAAAREDHGLARADTDHLAALVDVAVLPIALEALARLRIEARRIVRLDADHAARELLLAYELDEAAVQHELDALLAGRKLERPRQGHAVADGAGADEPRRDVHLHGRERARALGIGETRVLRGDRAGLDVRLVAEHQEADAAPRARHAAARMRAVDAREADIVLHQELASRGTVLGPRPDHLRLVVPVRRRAAAVDDRPISDVLEQQLDVVVELLGSLDRLHRDEAFRIALAPHVPKLNRVAAAERDERAAVQHA